MLWMKMKIYFFQCCFILIASIYVGGFIYLCPQLLTVQSWEHQKISFFGCVIASLLAIYSIYDQIDYLREMRANYRFAKRKLKRRQIQNEHVDDEDSVSQHEYKSRYENQMNRSQKQRRYY